MASKSESSTALPFESNWFAPSKSKLAGAALPPLEGAPIRISYRAPLLTRGGVIVARDGQAMHAASFIRRRSMVLDGELRSDPNEWRRIFVHELFHFAWVRLGNPARDGWRELLTAECRGHARGELGWSAEWRKKILTERDIAAGSPRWRDYACESFSDTAAWLYAGLDAHDEFTLSRRWREPRRRWFIQQFGDRAVPL
ncbi:MAG: hypothetical protein ABI972_27465 [Acidobacteriota bacterium]